jgi:hypothetical protein
MTGKFGGTPEERHRMIAETAYFLAHERGFQGGDPVADWIEAERRVDRQLRALTAARMVERLEAGVSSVSKNMVAITQRVSTLAAGARAELDADLEKLHALRLSLREKLADLKDRSDEAGQKAMQQAERVWNELNETLQSVTTRMHH